MTLVPSGKMEKYIICCFSLNSAFLGGRRWFWTNNWAGGEVSEMLQLQTLVMATLLVQLSGLTPWSHAVPGAHSMVRKWHQVDSWGDSQAATMADSFLQLTVTLQADPRRCQSLGWQHSGTRVHHAEARTPVFCTRNSFLEVCGWRTFSLNRYYTT